MSENEKEDFFVLLYIFPIARIIGWLLYFIIDLIIDSLMLRLGTILEKKVYKTRTFSSWSYEIMMSLSIKVIFSVDTVFSEKKNNLTVFKKVLLSNIILTFIAFSLFTFLESDVK